MSRALRWVPFALGAGLLAAMTLPAGRTPGGDAPHILTIAHRLAAELQAGAWTDLYTHLGSLVTPHPPAGYLVPTALAATGLGASVPVLTSLVGLALCWHGLVLLRGRAVPLWAGLLLLASPMTWAMADRMSWDLLAAGMVATTLGHLHASRDLSCTHHTAMAAFFGALGCLTKFTVPIFLVLPGILVLWGAVRNRRWTGIGIGLLVFAGAAGPWLAGHLEQVLAYVGSSADPSQTLSDSPAGAWAARLSWESLSYTPRVLKDALGWPGLVLAVLCTGGIGHRGTRLGLSGAVGGLAFLSFAGEHQARYLAPALPLICLLVDTGLSTGLRRSRWAKPLAVLVILPMLYGSAATSWVHSDPPTVRDQRPSPLSAWASWPWPAEAFRPTGLDLERWKVAETIEAIAEQCTSGSTIGIVLPRSPEVPRGSAYAYTAERHKHHWSWATVGQTPSGEPMVFLGPFQADVADRRFELAYIVNRPGQPTALDGLPQTELQHHRLPQGYQGRLVRIPELAWKHPAAQRLLQDPMDR
jgi:hypothetical protein